MGLTDYKRKRHFAKTPEAAGESAPETGWLYVIQKHDASRLHYDFRLELDHVLKSWAVPKGPSLDPSVKRLAVQVEDHPVAYGSFEGIIPQGEYGGGTVLLWDTGSWEPIGDPHAGLRDGKLKFILYGEKLRGGWALIRTRNSNSSKGSTQWLLIKERDAAARGDKMEDILEEQPLSVATGRDLDGIASGNERVLSSQAKQGAKRVSKRCDQPYRPGRGDDWLKIKCLHQDEFVIGGYTEPSGSRVGFGALLVGFHDAQGDLHYVGKVGTGFTSQTLKDLANRFQTLEQSTSPFVDLQRKTGDVVKAHWLKPSLVGQFNYGSRTRDGRLRHASFLGLREDIPAAEVRFQMPIPVEEAVRESTKMASNQRRQPKAVRYPTARPKGSNGTAASEQHEPEADTFAGVRLTHPDKVLYPDGEITKLELAQYFQGVADWILPHLKHRPLVVVRCPDGQGRECFYQKHPGVGTPPQLRQIPIQEKRKTEKYLVVDNVAGLVALAQIGSLELHAWGSREDKLEQPDRLIFDLDPAPEVPWDQVVDSARQVRLFLEDLGLESFLKTTGGKGLHLVVPIARRHDWDEVKSFCKSVAEAIERASPGQYTSNLSKATRTNKIFVDYLRNARGATAVVPYSPRASTNATVSVPITWEELSGNMHSDHFTVRNVLRRLNSLAHDPWSEFSSVRQSLTGPMRKLKSLS